jgi:ABC-type phosphate transport system substrate-binding protein
LGRKLSYNTDSVSVGYTSNSFEVALASYGLGLIDFMSFSSPMEDSDLTAAGSLQLPLVGGAIVVSYNLDGYLSPGQDVLFLDCAALAGIWLGDITRCDSPPQALFKKGFFLKFYWHLTT